MYGVIAGCDYLVLSDFIAFDLYLMQCWKHLQKDHHIKVHLWGRGTIRITPQLSCWSCISVNDPKL